jgi:ligand-binding SRPBCC domain-containing protein
MTVRTLVTEVWLPRPRHEVFAFFADAANLDRITPPWLRFQILTPLPVVMQTGALLDYRLRWRGIPLSWRTRIDAWAPPVRFVDRQLRGPYLQWIHTHEFEERDGGTWMRDAVDYAIPGWIVEPFLYRWLIGPDVERIFAYRKATIVAWFTNRVGDNPKHVRATQASD